jgi:hypothetical protein
MRRVRSGLLVRVGDVYVGFQGAALLATGVIDPESVTLAEIDKSKQMGRCSILDVVFICKHHAR